MFMSTKNARRMSRKEFVMQFVKPVIVASDDLAEGIYAASGVAQASGKTVTATVASTNWWGSEGQTTFNVTIPAGVGDHVIITLNFSGEVSNFWGGNGNCSVNGTVGKIDAWNPAETFQITAQSKEQNLTIKSASIAAA